MADTVETWTIVHTAGRLLTLALSGVFMSLGCPLAYGWVNDAGLVQKPAVIKTSNESNPYSRSTTNPPKWISIADDASDAGGVSGTQSDRRPPSSYRQKQRHYQFEHDLERRGRPRPRWNEPTRSQRCPGGKQATTCPRTSATIPLSQSRPHFAGSGLVDRRLS
jgi:hypothetical protein